MWLVLGRSYVVEDVGEAKVMRLVRCTHLPVVVGPSPVIVGAFCEPYDAVVQEFLAILHRLKLLGVGGAVLKASAPVVAVVRLLGPMLVRIVVSKGEFGIRIGA